MQSDQHVTRAAQNQPNGEQIFLSGPDEVVNQRPQTKLLFSRRPVWAGRCVPIPTAFGSPLAYCRSDLASGQREVCLANGGSERQAFPCDVNLGRSRLSPLDATPGSAPGERVFYKLSAKPGESRRPLIAVRHTFLEDPTDTCLPAANHNLHLAVISGRSLGPTSKSRCGSDRRRRSG